MTSKILFIFLATVGALPLQQNSLITLRTVLAPKGGGGNTAPPPPYGPLVLEEWNSTGLVQEWSVPCTLPGLSTETWTEGRLSSRYPWEDQVWFLCRNVPVNSSLSTNPAPVVYAYLNEEGVLGTWIEEPLYPNGTNVVNIIPYWDESQNLNIFYLLGGGTTANGPTSPAKPAQPRIRVDTGPGTPPDAQGALLSATAGITINQLRILNKTLYGTGLFGGSTGIPNPTIFQIGSESNLPLGTRNPTIQIPNFPLILSVWTDPFSDLWWRTGLNRTAYLALHDNSDGRDLVFALPASWTGGLGGATWTVATARKENSDFSVYLMNTTHIVKNTLNGLQSGMSYQPVMQAPPGWRYLSAHARNPNIPSPSATPTATATTSATPSASASTTSSSSATATISPTPTSSPSASQTARPSSTASSSASVSASANPSSTPTASRNPEFSPESSPSNSATTTPSNGTIPFPPDNSQTTGDLLTTADQAGIGLGSIAAICIAGLLLIKFTPTMKNLWTRQFGSSVKSMKKGVSFRNPVSADVPITISHNPQVIVQHRLEQLKDLQKQISMKELQLQQRNAELDRTKKQFMPVISGESV